MHEYRVEHIRKIPEVSIPTDELFAAVRREATYKSALESIVACNKHTDSATLVRIASKALEDTQPSFVEIDE